MRELEVGNGAPFLVTLIFHSISMNKEAANPREETTHLILAAAENGALVGLKLKFLVSLGSKSVDGD